MTHRTPKLIALLVVVILIALMSGCTQMPRTEIAWQTLHAVDVAQTLSIAKDPCYKESDPITRQLIGSDPSEGEVIAWGIASAVAHAGVSHLLVRSDAPRWLRVTWDSITIGTTVHALAVNHNEGIRPFGNNKPFPGCTHGG